MNRAVTQASCWAGEGRVADSPHLVTLCGLHFVCTRTLREYCEYALPTHVCGAVGTRKSQEL
jgi:hypothetical protein